MHLSSIFLAAIGVVLVSTEVVAETTSAGQTGVMKMALPDQDHFTPNNEPEKRFLRIHHPSNEEDEERLKLDKINQLMNAGSYRTTKFNKWIKKGFTDRQIYNKLDVDSNPSYSRIFHAYQNYIEQFAPRLVSN